MNEFRFLETSEEILCIRLREPDRIEFHAGSPCVRFSTYLISPARKLEHLKNLGIRPEEFGKSNTNFRSDPRKASLLGLDRTRRENMVRGYPSKREMP